VIILCFLRVEEEVPKSEMIFMNLWQRERDEGGKEALGSRGYPEENNPSFFTQFLGG